jgi:hypothetical protein
MQMCKLCIISTIIGTADGIAGGIVRITAAGIVRITAAGIAPTTAALIITGMARITGAGMILTIRVPATEGVYISYSNDMTGPG